MTTYSLTNQINNFTGGNGTDIFQGVAGGADTLRGNGGNDFFDILSGQAGLIDGGTGYDRLFLSGSDYNQLDANLQIAGIEELIVDSTNLFATVQQLSGITHYGVNNDASQFSLFLQGAGGTLNFQASFTEPQKLSIEANQCTSAVTIIGSTKADQVIGSDFNDNLSLSGGNDVAYGGDGNDVLNGGLGIDTLYGDDGADRFVFSTALGPTNVDKLGDFRPADDTIVLKSTVFDWAGQTLGTLKANEFKVVGTGQAVDADDRIIYNQVNGVISYDPDGAGGVAATPFAVALNFSGDVPVLTFQDFIIVA